MTQLQVRQQAKDRCELTSKVTGRRCGSKHFLENEHCIPMVKGGTNAIQNLRLFCRAHNALAAKFQRVLQSQNCQCRW
ncbi:MAG: HNH endonuclease [Pseudobdellovibrionaceae bacterium]